MLHLLKNKNQSQDWGILNLFIQHGALSERRFKELFVPLWCSDTAAGAELQQG